MSIFDYFKSTSKTSESNGTTASLGAFSLDITDKVGSSVEDVLGFLLEQAHLDSDLEDYIMYIKEDGKLRQASGEETIQAQKQYVYMRRVGDKN
jgi:hypothetical protein